jgi:hypothetical protein
VSGAPFTRGRRVGSSTQSLAIDPRGDFLFVGSDNGTLAAFLLGSTTAHPPRSKGRFIGLQPEFAFAALPAPESQRPRQRTADHSTTELHGENGKRESFCSPMAQPDCIFRISWEPISLLTLRTNRSCRTSIQPVDKAAFAMFLGVQSNSLS